MQHNAPQRQDSQFWIGLFLGGIIGALLIIILGTEKGKQLAQKLYTDGLDFLDDTKETLADTVREKVADIEQKSQELSQKGEELLAQGKALEQQIVDTVVEARTDVTEAAAEKVDETLAHIEKLQEHGRESTAQLRTRLFKNIPKRG